MVRVRHCLFFPFHLPFLSFSCLFLYPSFSFSFLFSCPFSFAFSFPFSFSFPFLFLSVSFPFPLPFLFFPFPSFTIPFPFPFPRSCEFFDQGVKPALGKTIRGKKTITSGKNNLKGLGVFTRPQVVSAESSRDVVALRSAVMRASRGMAMHGSWRSHSHPVWTSFIVNILEYCISMYIHIIHDP